MPNNSKVLPPFYDPDLTYEENFDKGPFNAFADGQKYEDKGEPTYDFFGHKVYLPFGIPAGPLINGKFVKAALDKGFDLPIYKSVRTAVHPCHPLPNVIPVDIKGDLTLEKAEKGLQQAPDYSNPISATNSFGIPSKDPSWWQQDMKDAIDSAKKGQVVLSSLQGTNRGQGVEAYIDDYVEGARLIKEAGGKILEVNYSCPNEGVANLLCYDVDRVTIISEKIRKVVGDMPVIIKIAYFPDKEMLKKLVMNLKDVVDGYGVINTISGKVYNDAGQPALGENRLYSGVCGSAIKWAGLDMTQYLNDLRKKEGFDFQIISSGGVTSAEDYEEYRAAGADVVMSGVGAMWNPYLAQDVKRVVL